MPCQHSILTSVQIPVTLVLNGKTTQAAGIVCKKLIAFLLMRCMLKLQEKLTGRLKSAICQTFFEDLKGRNLPMVNLLTSISERLDWEIKASLLQLGSIKHPPYKRLASNLSLQHHPRIKLLSQENKENDHQLKKLLIIRQILLESTWRNV